MSSPEVERIETLPKIYQHNLARIKSAINIGDYQGARELNNFLYSLVFNELADMNKDRKEGRTGGIDTKTICQIIKPWEGTLEFLSEQGVVIAGEST